MKNDIYILKVLGISNPLVKFVDKICRKIIIRITNNNVLYSQFHRWIPSEICVTVDISINKFVRKMSEIFLLDEKFSVY